MTNYQVTISNGLFFAVYQIAAESKDDAENAVLSHHNARLNEEEGHVYTYAKARETFYHCEKDPSFIESGCEG